MYFILTDFSLWSLSRATQQTQAREPFAAQFEQIVNNLNSTLTKVTNRRAIEKSKRDQLNQQLVDINEKQRQYYKLLKEFTEECRKNQQLVEMLKQENSEQN